MIFHTENNYFKRVRYSRTIRGWIKGQKEQATFAIYATFIRLINETEIIHFSKKHEGFIDFGMRLFFQ